MTCNANILDVFMKPIPLWSPSQPMPQEPAYDSHAQLFQDITDLLMLFVFQLTHTASSAGQLKKNKQGQINVIS